MSTLICLLALAAPARAEDKSGAAIYKEMCARCHGANGEGTKKYEHSLTGDWSVARLAKVIDHTMPEDDPDKLDLAESRKVAEYVHDAFYSPVAQAKLKPPRIELARLTVNQYRNSIADIIASFRPAAALDDKRGLRGEYFNARNFNSRRSGGNSRLIDRTDPVVDFDFKTDGPEVGSDAKTKFDPQQFSIRWEGSVLAPDTGTYEFVIRSDHAVRLWVNDDRQALLDRWVKSGSDTEFRASIFLLAGRLYPIRLEFSKAKQGVNDNDKKKETPPPRPAHVALCWKRPGLADEVIPARFLTPTKFPEVAVIDTAFPPDDRSFGWERGTAISREWDAATTVAAIETAGYITARLTELASADDPKYRAQRIRNFAAKFAERAFRKPLSDDERRLYIDRQFESAPDLELAFKRAVLLVLKSPRFLYPDAASASGPYATATRLALTLWDSAPDRVLLDAAAAGKLGTREEVARQAERMLADPRAKAKVREFLLAWLKIDKPKDLAKDAKRFPEFDARLAADLRTSLELFLDDVVWSESSDFRQLLLSDETYLNGWLARFYGAANEDDDPDAPFAKVKFEPVKRAGVLTHPYLLAALAYSSESSPIHRGVFVGRGLLGIPIKPPVDAFTPLSAELRPDLSTRERVSLQTKPAACAGCHDVMNPLGYALEHFDAVGRYREKDRAKDIDSSGAYETRTGEIAMFAGAKELARFLADSPEVHSAFVTQMFHHFVKQSIRAFNVNRPEELRKSFSANGFSVRKLVIEVAVTAALR